MSWWEHLIQSIRTRARAILPLTPPYILRIRQFTNYVEIRVTCVSLILNRSNLLLTQALTFLDGPSEIPPLASLPRAEASQPQYPASPHFAKDKTPVPYFMFGPSVLSSRPTMPSVDFWTLFSSPRDNDSTWQMLKPLRVMRNHLNIYTYCIYFNTSRGNYWTSSLLALSYDIAASYAVPVRQAIALPITSFRFHLMMDTFFVRLTVPLAGPVENLLFISERHTSKWLRPAGRTNNKRPLPNVSALLKHGAESPSPRL